MTTTWTEVDTGISDVVQPDVTEATVNGVALEDALAGKLDTDGDGSAVTVTATGGTASATLADRFQEVQTIAALKALPAIFCAAVGYAVVQGYHSAGDGGFGLFRWDNASTEADNGGTIIALTAGGTGRWKRLRADEREVWVDWFGTRGDGATDDLAAIQAAIDSAVPNNADAPSTRAGAMAGSATVRFSARVYRTTGTIYSGAYVRLVGSGAAAWAQQAYNTPASPNGTVILADFPVGIRSTAPIIHVSPFVLQAMTGQTVGTRYVSLGETWLSDSTDVDGGKVSYCDGTFVSDMTLYAVNETFCGIRWSAGSASRIERVAIKRVQYGIIGEANWESAIVGCKINNFSKYGYYGNGGQHSLVLSDNWLHAGDGGSSYLTAQQAGVRIVYGEGCHLIGNSFDDVFNAVELHASTGVVISGSQLERIRNIVLTMTDARGTRWIGGSLYNPSLPNSVIVDGANFSLDMSGLVCDFPHYSTPHTFPGKTFATGTNPNTSAVYLLNYTTNTNAAVFRGMAPRSGDPTSVTRAGGEIRFEATDGTVSHIANGSVANTGVDVRGTAAKEVVSHKFNGTQQYYQDITSTGYVFYDDTSNNKVFGFDVNDLFIWVGNVKVKYNWGSPEGFITAEPASLALDASDGTVWSKRSGSGNTGWVRMQFRQGSTTANRPASPKIYEFYWDTTLGKPIWWNGSAWKDATGATV